MINGDIIIKLGVAMAEDVGIDAKVVDVTMFKNRSTF